MKSCLNILTDYIDSILNIYIYLIYKIKSIAYRKERIMRDITSKEKKMDGFDVVSHFCVCIIVFNVLSSFAQVGPCECGLTTNQTFYLEIGNDLSERVYFKRACIGENFVWHKAGGDTIAFCHGAKTHRSGNNFYDSIECDNKWVDKFNINIECAQTFCTLIVLLENGVHSDSDIYFLESVYAGCRFVTINVIVKETKPNCTATFQKDSNYLRLICKWFPQQYDETVWFSRGDTTLYYHVNFMRRNKLSKYVFLDDAFCDEKAPEVCTLSQFGFYKSWSIFHKTAGNVLQGK